MDMAVFMATSAPIYEAKFNFSCHFMHSPYLSSRNLLKRGIRGLCDIILMYFDIIKETKRLFFSVTDPLNLLYKNQHVYFLLEVKRLK